MLAASAALAGLASAVLAQTPATRTETAETTATIVAIDRAARVIALKSDRGTVKMNVRSDVRRFDELKVGDQITFRYQESVLARISNAGQARLPASRRSCAEPVRARAPRSRSSRQRA
jgi:hypothetical protein